MFTQKVCSLIFNLLSSCSSLFILHAGCLWIFEWKIKEWKGRKTLFFCKLNIKDDNVFYTYTSVIKTIKIFTCGYIKKNLKNVYAFLINFLTTPKQLIRRNSICRLKNQANFSQKEHRDRFDSSPLLLGEWKRTLFPPSKTNPLLKRVYWKRWKELMITLVHSCI